PTLFRSGPRRGRRRPGRGLLCRRLRPFRQPTGLPQPGASEGNAGLTTAALTLSLSKGERSISTSSMGALWGALRIKRLDEIKPVRRCIQPKRGTVARIQRLEDILRPPAAKAYQGQAADH